MSAIVQLEITLPATFARDGDWVVASFPDIDVVTQGRTREEAKLSLIEAAQLFIESCFERGTLEEVLKACGFRTFHGRTDVAHDQDHLTVPVSLLSARGGSSAHAY